MMNVCVYWVVASRGSGELGPICNLSDLTPIHQVDLPLRDLRDNAQGHRRRHDWRCGLLFPLNATGQD